VTDQQYEAMTPVEVGAKRERGCAVEGCERPHYGKGHCRSHWDRLYNGRPIGGPFRRFTDIERFMARVDASAGDEACHPWIGLIRGGYGSFRTDGKFAIASRWILSYHLGRPLVAGEEACHHCDNPPCCNPRHLYVGDHSRNVQDAVERGRHRNPTADLRRAQTHCIRGHAFDVGNTYYRREDGCRVCRTCRRDAARNRARSGRAA